jgi:hypothetical protein
MKALSLFFLLVLSHVTIAQFQSYEFGVGYTYSSPIGTMQQNIKRGNGITLDFYVTPENMNRFAFGMDLNLTIYGTDESNQEYTFNDGTTAKMDIMVNNYFTNFMVGGRYYLTEIEGKKILPYVMLKGGYSWFRTDLNIYDPDDNDHCEPVDTDMLMKDGTFLFSGGAGFHYDLKNIFKKMTPDKFLFNMSASLTLGGQVNYMNTDPPDHNNNQHSQSDVTAQFVNTQTQVVHEHHVGYVYNSFVEMVDLRAGFVYRRN